MAGLEYLDFDLSIETSGQPETDSFRARVINSPAGQAQSIFKKPFSDLELENFYLRIGRPRQGVRRLDSPEMAFAKRYGARLFDAVFRDEVYGCFRASLNEAMAQEKGLRVRLRLDADSLVDLPWEYLYNSRLNRFLTLSVDTPLVRYIDLPQRPRRLQVDGPLNILVMISSPYDFQKLDVEREWAQLQEALKSLQARGLLTLERLDVASLANLQERLRQGDIHILHFIGHGKFDPGTQDGLLLFEDENERGHPLSGGYLGAILHNHPALRLVVLNACEGARTASSDPFAGVAQGLIQQGIPAVVAMQFEITDRAALAFSRGFYSALAAGYPVDGALVEARTAIFALGNDIEWGTPVLFSRAEDGRIFELGAPLARPDPEILPEKEMLSRSGAKTAQPEQTSRSGLNLLAWLNDRRLWIGGAFVVILLVLIWIFGLGGFGNLTSTPTPAAQIEITSTVEEANLPAATDTHNPSPEPNTPEPAPRSTAAISPTELPSEWADNYGVPMILIPAGEYEIGENADRSLEICQTVCPDCGCGRDWFDDEEPVHRVALGAYYIDRSEVTNELYIRCVEAGVCSAPESLRSNTRESYYDNSDFANYPVIFVSWDQAKTFCGWRDARLPSEAEWEVAARGGLQGALYPWGDDLPVCQEGAPTGANYADCGLRDTQPVGRYAPNEYGLYDMAGNIWEWVADWYGLDFYRFSPSTSPVGPDHGELRVVRGGAWERGGYELRVAFRSAFAPDETDNRIGFRCVRDK